MSDAELAQRVTGGCSRSFDELARRYRALRLSIAKDYFLVGQAREDVLQEALIGLHTAARYFDPDGNTAFSTFAALVIRRRLQTAVKAALRLRQVTRPSVPKDLPRWPTRRPRHASSRSACRPSTSSSGISTHARSPSAPCPATCAGVCWMNGSASEVLSLPT